MQIGNIYIYNDQIEMLSREINNVFGFYPTVVNGPKSKIVIKNYDCVYLDTKNRRLFLMRPRVNNKQPDFILHRNS
jgi:hypothetical protein